MLRAALILLGLAAICLGCSQGEALSLDDVDTPSVEQQDAKLAQDVAKGQEARAWLAREDTTLFEISKDQGREIVEAMYSAGSPAVTMIDSDKLSEDSNREIGSTFVAELPQDPATRKRIFEAYQKIFEEEEKDQGQKYLWIATD